LLILTHATSVF